MANAAANVSDPYFHFSYPFLVSLRGVTITGLPAFERESNLAMLKFISDECSKRAIDFQLGLWNHSIAYSSSAYEVQGLSASNGSVQHAEYCRDALSAILEACPSIRGLTFRVHSESGIGQSNYAFWEVLFSGVTSFVNAGRQLEIDMHGKSCDKEHIDAAAASQARVVVSPKRWAEHMGLPYLILPRKNGHPIKHI